MNTEHNRLVIDRRPNRIAMSVTCISSATIGDNHQRSVAALLHCGPCTRPELLAAKQEPTTDLPCRSAASTEIGTPQGHGKTRLP
jgi:hypothetical protein